jgi:hypothetical protein
MNLLLDFIETEFGLLPVESPGESIIILPSFVALVGVALWDTSVWVSLYGEQNDFDGNDTVIGQFPNWRKFHVQNRDNDIMRAKNLIQQACENYRRSQGYRHWDDMVRDAEERWLDNREQEKTSARRQQLLRDL